MVKKNAELFLFIGVAALGVVILAVAVGNMVFAVPAIFITFGGFIAAAWRQRKP